MQQHEQQREEAENAHNAEVAVGVLVVHRAFIGGQNVEVAAHPVGELLQAEAVGRQQQAADAQAVDVRADGAAVDAVGQRAALSVQDAQHHREEIGDHPGDDLAIVTTQDVPARHLRSRKIRQSAVTQRKKQVKYG